jgi:hypothetical protein
MPHPYFTVLLHTLVFTQARGKLQGIKERARGQSRLKGYGTVLVGVFHLDHAYQTTRIS